MPLVDPGRGVNEGSGDHDRVVDGTLWHVRIKCRRVVHVNGGARARMIPATRDRNRQGVNFSSFRVEKAAAPNSRDCCVRHSVAAVDMRALRTRTPPKVGLLERTQAAKVQDKILPVGVHRSSPLPHIACWTFCGFDAYLDFHLRNADLAVPVHAFGGHGNLGVDLNAVWIPTCRRTLRADGSCLRLQVEDQRGSSADVPAQVLLQDKQ